jgi:hypothetical protein
VPRASFGMLVLIFVMSAASPVLHMGETRLGPDGVPVPSAPWQRAQVLV